MKYIKNMKITKIKSLWPEKKGFFLERKDTGDQYIFLHLLTPALLSDREGISCRPAGSVICYDKHSYQYLQARDQELVHDWIHFTGEAKEMFRSYGLSFNTVYPLRNDGFVTELTQEAELELLRQKPHAQALCSLRLEELFLRISRSVQDREDLSVPLETKAAFTSVRTKIHLNYSHPWKVEEMARLLHLSPSRFYQLYQLIFGVSPKQDLHMIRLEHAKNLLIGSRYTVQEIAEMVGYTNQYYFIRSFRSATGKTPGQYRKCN